MEHVAVKILKRDIEPEIGNCWTATIPELAPGDTISNPLASHAQLFEDGDPSAQRTPCMLIFVREGADCFRIGATRFIFHRPTTPILAQPSASTRSGARAVQVTFPTGM
jgi:hypothetical protein